MMGAGGAEQKRCSQGLAFAKLVLVKTRLIKVKIVTLPTYNSFCGQL